MTLDPQLRDTIIAAVDKGFDAQIKFTQKMIRFNSQRGEEHAIQDFVFRALRSRGYAMDRFEMDRAALEKHPGAGSFSDEHSTAPIVVGIHRPREETGRSLILQAHVDVVPDGTRGDQWTHAPFDRGDRGRLALWPRRGRHEVRVHGANIFACLDALSAASASSRRRRSMSQSVVEEESTGNGALMTHLRGYRGRCGADPRARI